MSLSDEALYVGQLAIEVPTISADTSVAQVDKLFRRDSRLRSLIVRLDTGVALLCRDEFDDLLSGPFGYGRSLHSRSVAGEVVRPGTLVLGADMTLSEAAGRILARDDSNRYRDALVIAADGSTAVVGVSAIFEQLASVFRHVALHDPLTGLPNRRLLDQQGADLVQRGVDPATIAILYVDLDGFKLVNDTLGHRAGDDLLVGFAGRLRSCLRPEDSAARLGGDEFAALLVGVSEPQALAVAERIILAASTPFVHDGESIHVSASVGVAMANDIGHEHGLSQFDALLRLADGAMLQAKRSGKHRVERIPAGEHTDSVIRQAAIRRRLRSALPDGRGLTLHYQPKLDLRTGRVDAVEALLRWYDDELGPISPAEFIPVAEDSEQILRLGAWVMREACRQARCWLDDGQPRTVSVNVSPVQFRDTALVQVVRSALAEHALPPALLRIEITETSAVLDLGTTLLRLDELNRLGVLIELDDFGTGFSSLSMLRQLPLSAVKIDKSFIDDIDTDDANSALIEGVVGAAHALGLTVTAEGVERVAQLAVLRGLGCDSAQGFLIARPQPALDLTVAAPVHELSA